VPRFEGGAPAAAAAALTAVGAPLGGARPPPAAACVPFLSLRGLMEAGGAALPPPAAADISCGIFWHGESRVAVAPGARLCVAGQHATAEKEPAPVVFRDGVSAGNILHASGNENIVREMGGSSLWVCNTHDCNVGPEADACIASPPGVSAE
jgi:hypothetical protein